KRTADRYEIRLQERLPESLGVGEIAVDRFQRAGEQASGVVALARIRIRNAIVLGLESGNECTACRIVKICIPLRGDVHSLRSGADGGKDATIQARCVDEHRYVL